MPTPKAFATLFTAGALAALVSIAPARAAENTDWKWSITPYIWATSVKVDAVLRDSQTLSTDVSFGDLIDKLDFAAMVHAEGQRGKFGMLFDVVYADLADEDQVSPIPPLPGATVTADAGLQMTIFEAAGIYNPSGEVKKFAVLFGTRVFVNDLDVDATFDLGGPSVARSFSKGDTLVDAMLGVRYIGDIAKHWSYQVRADASALGTDLAWSAGAGFGFAWGKEDRFGVNLGYRYMDIKFDTDDAEHIDDLEQVLAGPILGFRFSF
jgi:hypothetical protein